MSTEEITNNFVVVSDEAETLDTGVEKKEEAAPSADKQTAKPAEKADDKAAKPDEKKPDGKPDGEKEDDGKDKPDADDASGKPHQRRFEKRINRVTKRAKLAEERASTAEERAAKAERELAEYKSENAKPKPEDFDKHKDYEAALEKWTEGKPKPAQQQRKQQPNAEFTEALAEVQDSFEDGKKAHDDFEAVVHAQDLRITEPMIIAMADADDPSEIAYYLGTHKSEATRIAELSPLRQAKEIAKIEAKLSAKGDDKGKDVKADKPEDKPLPKKTTQAPPPVNPVSGNDASEKRLEDMDFAEFEQSRKQSTKSKFW